VSAVHGLAGGGRSSAKGARVEAPNLAKGTEGVSLPTVEGFWGGGTTLSPEIFLDFEWKMAHFGAFWVLFMQTAVI